MVRVCKFVCTAYATMAASLCCNKIRIFKTNVSNIVILRIVSKYNIKSQAIKTKLASEGKKCLCVKLIVRDHCE